MQQMHQLYHVFVYGFFLFDLGLKFLFFFFILHENALQSCYQLDLKILCWWCVIITNRGGLVGARSTLAILPDSGSFAASIFVWATDNLYLRIQQITMKITEPNASAPNI